MSASTSAPRSAVAGASAEPAECGTTAPAAEKRFEEIAEPGSAELELNSAAAIAAPLIKSAAGLLLALPLRRRLETAGPVPIRAELIVFLPLFRIAQNFVRFVDLLKFFFGGLFVLGHIGVILARQLAKSAANFVLARRFRHPECLVIISELYRHLPNLCVCAVRAMVCTTAEGRRCDASVVCVRSGMRELGKFIVIIGVVATLVGLVMWSGFAPKWLGRLPGDIRIEREHSSFYFPIVTCIVLSIVLSLLFSLFSIFRR